MTSVLRQLHRLLLQSETLLLMALFLSLIVITVVQIVMRNFFASGIIWAESYVRFSVLWIAMLGAMVASRDGQHLNIDVLVNKLPANWRRLARRLTAFFTAIVCSVIAWHSLAFVRQEYEFGGIAFGAVPNWLCEAIIPLAFSIIACRYLLASVLHDSHSD